MSMGRLDAVKCDRCGKLACDIKEAEVFGWNWFTGFLPQTEHYCRPCQDADPVSIEARYRLSRNEKALEARE